MTLFILIGVVILLAVMVDIDLTLHSFIKDLKMAPTQFANIQQAVDTLTAEVAKDTGIETSAALVINTVPDLIKAAVADALQKGAPPSTLSAFSTLNDVLIQKSAGLAAAVAANIAAFPPPVVGTTQVTVPAIPAAGVDAADYETALTGLGLVVGAITTVDGTTLTPVVPSGDVASTNPAAGSLVNPGATVNIVLAQ